MNYGVPVISSRSTSLIEVVGDGGILVKANDADLYTEELKNIWDNKKKRSDLKKKGFSWAEKFNWENTARSTMSVYKKLCKLRRHGSKKKSRVR